MATPLTLSVTATGTATTSLVSCMSTTTTLTIPTCLTTSATITSALSSVSTTNTTVAHILSSRTTFPTNVTAVSSEETNFLRFSNLMFKRAPKAVRTFFDIQHPPCFLTSTLNTNKVKLSKLKVIKQHQWNILFPTSGVPVTSREFDITLLICLLRNMAPKVVPPQKGFDTLPSTTDLTEGADLARIKYYRNLVAHTTDGKLSDKDLNDYWAILEQTLFRLGGNTILAEIRNLRVATLDDSDKELMKELQSLLKQLQDKIPENVRDLINHKVEMWMVEDRIFVETRASTNVYNAISKQSCVTVIGNPGSGKSAIIHHVALMLRQEGYTIVTVRSPSEITAYLNKDIRQVFVIDDPFGGHCADHSLLRKWMCREGDIDLCINQKDKQGHRICKLLVSSRISITRNVTFTKINLLFANMLNLHDSDNSLSIIERKNILRSHAKKELDVPESVLSLHDCFPLLCQNLSKNESLKMNPTKYFEHPFSEYCTELDLWQEDQFDGPLHYCALVLCTLFGDSFTLSVLSARTSPDTFKNLQDLYEACGLDSGTSVTKIKKALRNLTDVYVKQVGDTFCLVHSTLRDIIAWHFSCQGDNIFLIVKYACSSLFNERVRPLGKLTSDKGDDSYFLKSKDNLVPAFVRRIFNDLENGKFVQCFENPNFPNQILEENILECMQGNPKMYFNLFPQCSMSDKRLDLMNLASKHTILSLYRLPFLYWCLCYGWFTSVKLALKDTLLPNRESMRFLTLFSGNTDLINFIHNFDNTYNSNECTCLFCDTKGSEKNEHRKDCPIRIIPTILIPCVTGNKDVLNEMLRLKLCRNNDWKASFHFANATTTPLHIACTLGHYEIVLKLVELGASFCQLDDKGNYPFHLACEKGHLNIVKKFHRTENVLNLFNTRKESPLWIACFQGHLEIVKFLCKQGVMIDSTDVYSCTPLGISCEMGYFDIASFLISKQANINMCDVYKWTPLMKAVFGGYTNIVKCLLEHGANVHLCNEDGESPLMIAFSYCTKDLITLLLQFDAGAIYGDKGGILHIACKTKLTDDIFQLLLENEDVNEQGENERTPLMVSVENTNFRAATLLLQNGADLSISDINDNTSLHLACAEGNFDITQLLLTYQIDINAQNKDGKTALYMACEMGHSSLLTLLFQADAQMHIAAGNGLQPLHIACCNGHLKVVEHLTEYGVSVSESCVHGRAPLYYASIGGHFEIVCFLLSKNVDVTATDKRGYTSLHGACKSGNVQCVTELISQGADINYQTIDGYTPLILASYECHEEIVLELVQKGANTCVKSHQSSTALHMACIKGHARIAEILVENGADLYIVDGSNQDSLSLAIEQSCSDVITVLLKKYALNKIGTDRQDRLLDVAFEKNDIDLLDKVIANAPMGRRKLKNLFLTSVSRGKEKIASVFIKHGIDITTKDQYGMKAFHIACKFGYCNIVSLLLEKGSNVNERDKDNLSGLDNACLKGHENVVVKLINSNANIHALDKDGNTCLYYAQLGCHENIISKLIENGADINVMGNTGLTCLHLATLEGHLKKVEILLNQGADPNKPTLDGYSPLAIAVSKQFDHIESSLLKRGADINYKNTNGNTVLHTACLRNEFDMASLLLQRKASVNIKNNKGCTPLDIAMKEGHTKLKVLLREHGANFNRINDKGMTSYSKILSNYIPFELKDILQNCSKTYIIRKNGYKVHLNALLCNVALYFCRRSRRHGQFRNRPLL